MPHPPYPHYPLPAVPLLDLVLAILTGQKRSFRVHAQKMIASIRPPLVTEGRENIPQAGPAVITTNHYYRKGFWAPWFTAAISTMVPGEIYWTMTDAFTYPGRPFERIRRGMTHWALVRVARVYDFNSMPPMPPAPHEVTQRAASIQRLLRYARANPHALIGLAPEGGDQPAGILRLPPDGFGRLALALAEMGMQFYPVGVFEVDGRLHVRFGKPYRLANTYSEDRHAADLQARRQVMCSIAACLPAHLQGEFSEYC